MSPSPIRAQSVKKKKNVPNPAWMDLQGSIGRALSIQSGQSSQTFSRQSEGLATRRHFHTPKPDAAQSETWLVALPVSYMASWAGLGHSNRPNFPDLQPSVWRSGYARLLRGELLSVSTWGTGDAPGFLPSPPAHVIGGNVWFSPRAIRSCTNYKPGPHISPCGLPHPISGCQGLSFVVDDVTPPDHLDIPTQVCPLDCNTLLPLSQFFHEWKHLPGVLPCVLQFGYTLKFGRKPQPSMGCTWL